MLSMPHLKIKLNGEEVGGWLAELSAGFPTDEFRLLATQLRDEGALVTLEVQTPDGGDIIQEFETTPEVANVEVLHADSQVVLLQFLTRRSKVYDPLYESGCISIYPTLLQNGWFSVHVAAGHDSLRQLFGGTDGSGSSVSGNLFVPVPRDCHNTHEPTAAIHRDSHRARILRRPQNVYAHRTRRDTKHPQVCCE